MNALLDELQSYVRQPGAAEIAFMLMAGAAVFIFALGALYVVSALANPLRRRVQQLGQSTSAGTSSTDSIMALLQPISAYLLPGKEPDRSRINQLLIHAGYRSENALALFHAVKALLMLLLPLGVYLVTLSLPQLSSSRVLFYSLGAAFGGSILPSIWLDRRVRARQRLLRTGFPDALDLLVVCVESGLGLSAALQRVADEMAVSHPELGTELGCVNAEMRAGVDRAQALKNLADRTGLEDIRGLVALLVQTMRFGTSVADALRVYSEEFRDKRMQAAEEQAAKMGTKMIFPLVLCLFPSFFLVAIGPAVLKLVKVFGQMGS